METRPFFWPHGSAYPILWSLFSPYFLLMEPGLRSLYAASGICIIQVGTSEV